MGCVSAAPHRLHLGLQRELGSQHCSTLGFGDPLSALGLVPSWGPPQPLPHPRANHEGVQTQHLWG